MNNELIFYKILRKSNKSESVDCYIPFDYENVNTLQEDWNHNYFIKFYDIFAISKFMDITIFDEILNFEYIEKLNNGDKVICFINKNKEYKKINLTQNKDLIAEIHKQIKQITEKKLYKINSFLDKK